MPEEESPQGRRTNAILVAKKEKKIDNEEEKEMSVSYTVT